MITILYQIKYGQQINLNNYTTSNYMQIPKKQIQQNKQIINNNKIDKNKKTGFIFIIE